MKHPAPEKVGAEYARESGADELNEHLKGKTAGYKRRAKAAYKTERSKLMKGA